MSKEIKDVKDIKEVKEEQPKVVEPTIDIAKIEAEMRAKIEAEMKEKMEEEAKKKAIEMAKKEASLEREFAKEERSVKAKLKKEKKVKILIPEDPNNPDEVVPVGYNGIIYAIPTGQEFEVPESIYKVWKHSYEKTREANKKMKKLLKKELQIM